MRIVVTGASGNIGTALLRTLADEHDVVAVSRRRPPTDVQPYDRVQWVQADLAEPNIAGPLADMMTGADAVVHLAWLIQPSRDRPVMRATNVGGTQAVLDAVARAGVGHLVHLSSLGAYSPAARGQVVDESWPTGGLPTSPYSVDKVAAERLLDGYEDSLTITRLRPTVVLQEDSASEIGRYFLGRWLPRAFHPALMRLVPWPRELAVQFVHADDVAAAIALVLRERAGGAFNVAADPVIDRAAVRQLFGGVGPPLPAAALRIAAAATWHARVQPTDPGWVDIAVRLPLLDSAKLRGLGWTPQHRGDDTLRAFVDALAHGNGHAGPLLYSR